MVKGSGTSDDRDPAAVTRFVDRFTQVMVDSGMPRIASRIFVTLLATDTSRCTAAELAELTQASPAAISGGVRYLVAVGLIHRGRESGSRRDFYAVESDVWYRTIAQRDQLMSQWTSCLRDGAGALGEATPAGARFAESVEFFEFMQKELVDMIARWEEQRRPRG